MLPRSQGLYSVQIPLVSMRFKNNLFRTTSVEYCMSFIQVVLILVKIDYFFLMGESLGDPRSFDKAIHASRVTTWLLKDEKGQRTAIIKPFIGSAVNSTFTGYRGDRLNVYLTYMNCFS